MLPRRGFLSLIGAAATAGCSSEFLGTPTPTPTPTPRPDKDNDELPDVDDDYPDNAVRGKEVIAQDRTFTVDPGSHEAIRFASNQHDMLYYHDFLVTDGDVGVDVYLFDRENYTKYLDGNEGAEYYSYFSGTRLGTGTVKQFLASGRYALVFDYTNFGPAPGPTPIEIDLDLDIAKVPPVLQD